MTARDKFIEDLKANGYQEGDLSTLPSDISNADRKKVEQHEADLANERMKNTQGVKPDLQEFHVQLNPNQYGFAEQAETANSPQTSPAKAAKANPLDHDNDGKSGGSAYSKPVDNGDKTDKK